ncbi:HlyC/CorC family transporter [Candidatus Parcubacteria bacterium]|nr:HlyC/CorC family transporter [Candidatus Parcubacteria bacterium]
MIEYIILFFLILLSAFFSCSETALFSLSPVKVRMMMEQKKKGAGILYKLKRNPRKLIVTILLGNNVVNIAASALATIISTELFGSQGVGIAIGIMTLLILVFGEIIPKSMAVAKAEKISLIIAKPISFIMYLLWPFVWILEQTAKMISSTQVLVSEEEIKTMAMMGLESGIIKKQEEKIIERAVEFADINTEDVMTPRIDMFCLNGKLNLDEALSDIIASPFSRIPIYIEDKDNIIGILYVKDVLKHIAEKDRNIKLAQLTKKPFIVPEKMSINKLFKEFQYKHIHIAIVVNEHGEVVGVTTMEDLLEELVGEIIDESDLNKELIMRIDKKTILVDGDTEIDDINDFFNIKLPGKITDTISAVILEKIQKIPQKGEKIKINNFTLTVEAVTPREIKKVKIEK